MKALGCMTYPPLYFTDGGHEEILQSAEEQLWQVFRAKRFEGTQVWFRKDGYVVVGTEDKVTAMRILDAIFLGLTLSRADYPLLPSGEAELEAVDFDTDTGCVHRKLATVVSVRGVISLFPNMRMELFARRYLCSGNRLDAALDLV